MAKQIRIIIQETMNFINKVKSWFTGKSSNPSPQAIPDNQTAVNEPHPAVVIRQVYQNFVDGLPGNDDIQDGVINNPNPPDLTGMPIPVGHPVLGVPRTTETPFYGEHAVNLEELPKDSIVAGVNISRYATDPNHEAKINRIYNEFPSFGSANDLSAYIKQRFPKSPINGDMVYASAQKAGIDPKLLAAIIQNDSAYGTTGKGAMGKNAGNYGNNDRGNTVKFKSWEEGLDSTASLLAGWKTE